MPPGVFGAVLAEEDDVVLLTGVSRGDGGDIEAGWYP